MQWASVTKDGGSVKLTSIARQAIDELQFSNGDAVKRIYRMRLVSLVLSRSVGRLDGQYQFIE